MLESVGVWGILASGGLIKKMLPFVAVVVGVVLFEATMVMTMSLCGECATSRRRRPGYGVMWSAGRSGGRVGSATEAKGRKDLLQ